ncbi:MAG: hypothetical protein QXJ40_02425, partial [Candidatus Bathyarchaeia archaeon]
ASETVHFTVANPAKTAILQALTIIVPVLAVVIVATAIIKRYKRRQHQPKKHEVKSSNSE